MKKRTVKDFIALYAQEDGGKAGADPERYQRGQNLSGYFLDGAYPCPCHGGCPDRTGDLRPMLPELAADGQGEIRRLFQAVCQGPDLPDQSPRLERRCPPANLSGMSRRYWRKAYPVRHWREIWAEYTKPILLEDEVLGTLTLDREMSMFTGTCRWMKSPDLAGCGD